LLPENRDNVAKEFIHHLETGEPVHQTLEMMFNLEAMAILDAGVRSTSTGKSEMVENASWQKCRANRRFACSETAFRATYQLIRNIET